MDAKEAAREKLLYPAIPEPRSSGRLKVSAVHELYYEESGNPSGNPGARRRARS
ncbi:MAG: hypothetical protein BJ554DRAFT_4491 [Olpidium bornovanus]|uniref:Uncharacterized protein n=1 Tax=Olpidium bornovanus TaxID=278681 RepID=A0A8H7ZM48_9FUNG|nr:MAG: hypothetical protein BJ554DRAFT_4491 [Olpidium bornovanus]